MISLSCILPFFADPQITGMRMLRLLLFPFSMIYAIVIRIRHALYDAGWLKSARSPVPAIVVGNLSTGGTGKTPFSILLLHLLLRNGVHSAFLSRGYRRQTSGYFSANQSSDSEMIGDEPALIHRKFPNLPLAVCEDRIAGIHQMLQGHLNVEAIVLDDAFQHRRLRAHFNVLLTTYNDPYYRDWPLPAGNLRDLRREKRRAQAIVVTKCPPDLTSAERERITREINPSEAQRVFFAKLVYGTPMTPQGRQTPLSPETAVAAFCGIANPEPFRRYLDQSFKLKKIKIFPDHHPFSDNDINYLAEDLVTFAGPAQVLLTTEKDAERLAGKQLPKGMNILLVPVEMKLMDDEAEFEQMVLSAVRK